MMLSDVCLSRISGLTREQRGLRRTKIGTEVVDVTRDSDTTFKVKRSRSPGRFTQRGINAYGGCSGQRGNVFGVGKYCYVVSARRRWGVARGEGRGISYRVATRTACYTKVCNEYSSTGPTSKE